MNLEERIQNKINQIAKMEKNLKKYVVDDEFTAMCDRYFETKDATELKQYKLIHNLSWLPEYYSKRYDLESAKETLAKYYKQLEVENSKNATLNDLPEVVVEFKKELIERWNSYDIWRRENLRAELNRVHDLNGEEYRTQYRELQIKYNYRIREILHETDEEINKRNVKDAETIVLNMINRVAELTGKITDCKYLNLSCDNNGYTIINGIIIGEKGKARIESIGAGGYNIQRYHIRVLVKEVR